MPEHDHRGLDRHRMSGRTAARLAAIIGALVLLGYLLVSALAADRLTRPSRATHEVTPAAVGLDFQNVQFPARHDSVRIAGWYLGRPGLARPGDAPAVVMAHGRGSSRATEFDGRWVEVAEALWHAGFSVLMVDLRGHGLSGEGRLAFGLRERRDVAGAVDWLLAAGHAAGRVGLLGVSLGGAAALGAAADAPEVGAVVADAVYADVEPVIEREWERESGLPIFFLPSTRLMARVMLGYDPAAARPVEDAARIAPRPLLLIHGGEDRLIPPHHAHALRSAHGAARLWVVEGAGHGEGFLVRPDAYTARVTAFFEGSLQRHPPHAP